MCGSTLRDRALEAELLDFAEELAQRAYGIPDASLFSRTVKSRLTMGQEMYGELFMSIDNLAEAREEALDGAAYALLELQRLGEDNYGEMRMLAVAMIAAAMNLDLATRQWMDWRRDHS